MRLQHAVGIGALIGAITAGSLLWPGATPAHSPIAPLSGTVKCGVERWDVKTLTDRYAADVRLTPVPTTIAQLRSRRAPKTLPAARMAPTETTVFQVTAQVTGFKLEADRDIHVVLADADGETMIAEFPDVDHCAATSFQAASMRTARAAFIAAYGEPTPTFTQAEGQATFTGVGFWDSVHGQKGVAPSGIELHPILGFAKGDQ